MTAIEQWDRFELTLSGRNEGNPFLDVTFGAEFRNQHRVIKVDGFYDGDGMYRVRFMPDVQGNWQFITFSNADELTGVEGSFICTAPSENNHGVVRVRNIYHFAYDDGKPY